jgi:hypothetical protein
METFVKQPSETYPIAMEFDGKLPTGSTVASGTISAINALTGADATGIVLASPTATIQGGTQAVATIQSGTDGVTYKLTFLVTLTPAALLEEDLLMQVVAQ